MNTVIDLLVFISIPISFLLILRWRMPKLKLQTTKQENCK